MLTDMTVVRSERTLAVACPRVAAMWHPSGNGHLSPDRVSATSALQVRWRCANGHEWSEEVRHRAAAREWKRGQIDACGLCLGYHVMQTCGCGKQRIVQGSAASNSIYECGPCLMARVQERQNYQRLRVANRNDYVATFAEADALLDPVVPANLPPALAIEWRRRPRKRLLSAMEEEFGYGRFGTAGAVDAALRKIQREPDRVPTRRRLRDAHKAGEPIEFLDRVFWTQGVLYVLGIRGSIKPRDQLCDQAILASLKRSVRAGIDRRRQAGSCGTAEMTAVLTELVQRWGARTRTGPWRGYLELTPPFIPTTGQMCGKMDIVLTHAGSPDLVVEIDSTPCSRSLEKLQFAQEAGATAIWIRWHHGAAYTAPGVHVIDLVAETRWTKRV